jgi:hypothetical protein
MPAPRQICTQVTADNVAAVMAEMRRAGPGLRGVLPGWLRDAIDAFARRWERKPGRPRKAGVGCPLRVLARPGEVRLTLYLACGSLNSAQVAEHAHAVVCRKTISSARAS